MNRSRQAQLNYASGYSCEQAIFTAFAGEMGLSLVGAQQKAPKVKDRGTRCGAVTAALRVLENIQHTDRDVHEAQEPGSAEISPAKLEFGRAFLARYGTMECKELHGLRTGLSDCLDVIGFAAKLLETLIEKYNRQDVL